MIRILKIVVVAMVAGWLAGCAIDPQMKPWWTLNEKSFIPVEPGTTKDAVRRLLGKPILELTFPRMNEEVWDYRHLYGVTDTYITEVHFNEKGVVKYYTQYPDPAVRSNLLW